MQVYRIFNMVNSKSYVGITQWDFKTRYPQGRWWKWTHSDRLKMAVAKYGLENFKHEILWDGQTEYQELLEMEKLYIKQYNSFVPNGYNMTFGGSKNGPPTHIKEYELMDFSGSIHKIRNLKKFCQINKLNYSAMQNMTSGINTSSQGYALSSTPIEKITIPNEEWVLDNINTGEIAIIKRGNVGKWATSKNLKPSLIERIIYKEVKCSHGWKLKETKLDSNYKFTHKNVKLLDPNGNIIDIPNIYRFCKENGFDRQSFYPLINGEAMEACGGWRLPGDEKEFNKKKSLRMGRYIKLISPTGELIEIKNISQFCRENGLKRNSFQAIVSGQTKTHKGWRIYNEKQ